MRARAKTCFENLREDVDVSHSETLRMLNKKLTRFPQSLSFETKGSASRVNTWKQFQKIGRENSLDKLLTKKINKTGITAN